MLLWNIFHGSTSVLLPHFVTSRENLKVTSANPFLGGQHGSGNNDDATQGHARSRKRRQRIGGFATRNAARQAGRPFALRRRLLGNSRQNTRLARHRSGPRSHAAHGALRGTNLDYDRVSPRRRSAHVHTRERGTDADSHKFENAAGRHLPRREGPRAALGPGGLRRNRIHAAPARILGRLFPHRRA